MTNGIFRGILLSLCAFSFDALLRAQTTGPGTSVSSGTQTGGTSSGASAQMTAVPQAGDQSFEGSVPQGTASATPVPLSLGDAINRGLKANLGLLTSEQSSREVRAERIRALAGLLPKINGQLSATEQQLNLQAIGFLFSIPGIHLPSVVGPYNYESALVNASIPILDFNAIYNYRASRESQRASALSIKNARDLVVLAVGDAYLQIIADAARITAAQAEIDADNAVYTNAVRRHDAGTAIGIDVLRSQVELKQRQQALVAVSNQFEKDKLSLGRIIGLPPGQDFTVSDPSPSVPLEAMSLQDALAKAYANRPDYQAAKAQMLAARFTLSAARAERYPSATVTGFYGAEGLGLFSNSHGVFNATGSINIPIYQGGEIRADILRSEAELKNRSNEFENLRGQIDSDVRNALLDLKSSGIQVDVARSNVDLAAQTLKQAQDRFGAGVTNTVEVVQAQQTVADANENLISAQFQYNIAKVSLARALGLADETIRTYFNQHP